MVKDPFKEWDRVDTFCTLLFDLGMSISALFCYQLMSLTDNPGTDKTYNSLLIHVIYATYSEKVAKCCSKNR